VLIIAHRGNLNGPNPGKENHPSYIDEAIRAGFAAEIDLWVLPVNENMPNGPQQAWLGHDRPQYGVDWWWFESREDFLWIHCKNLAALEFCENHQLVSYFAHDKDDFVLTSCGTIWTYPKSTIQLCKKSIPVIFNRYDMIWPASEVVNAYGICTDDALYYDALFNASAT
jgi:hypothetical protein